jgi:ketosteroid isomerase-like protein
MSLEMHTTLERYFAATNRHDVAGMTADLTEDAVVSDEGRQHRGIPAIRAWTEEALRKYEFSARPTDVAREDGRIAVRVEVTGNFPGSPIALTYRFKLAGQKIAQLEIG